VFYRYDDFTVEDSNAAASLTRDAGDTEAKVHNLGVNWYVNEAVKLSGVYVKAKTDNVYNAADDVRTGDDDGDGFVFRAQYVF